VHHQQIVESVEPCCRILVPQIVDDQGTWVDPKTDAAIALIGELCQVAGEFIG
jgi:hypothetical protein